MSKDLPDLSDQDVVKLMAAQKTLMDNKQHHEEYKENILEYSEKYDVEVVIND